MRTVKIIMLSGGYDSTGLLFWALGHKDWFVIAHHIELVNAENRSGLETQAIEKIIEYTGCEYSTSKIENMDPVYFAKDIINVGFMAAIVAKSSFLKFRRLDKEDPDIEVFTGGTLEDHCYEQIEAMDGIGVKNKIFEVMFADFDFPGANVPRIKIPFRDTPKVEVVKYIPTELLPYIWTCRVPTRREGKFAECGVCAACQRKRLISEAA
jgi:7-cyano-7-deazaguanine synthase in queuosine biosynthesis